MKQSSSVHLQKRRLLILILLFAAVLLSFAGVTAARYIQYQETGGLAQAPNFYFTSNLLREKGADETIAKYYIDPQSSSFAIQLMNYADSQRYTAKDIQYTVAVDGGSAEIQDGAADKQTLAGGEAHTAEIVVTRAEASADSPITVTVSSSKPYAKTLTAQFIPALGNHYSREDEMGNTAAVLTMTCTDGEKEIPLTLPEGVIPDATDHRVSKNATGNSYTFAAPGQGVYALVLLKTEKKNDLSCESTAFADKITITAP